MNGMLRVPRSRGALSGLLLVLLGAWGALIPFVGPYFHYAYTPDSAWTYTTGRFWLEILPGVGAILGGLIVLVSSNRPFAIFGAWLAALSGAWFALGSVLAPTWSGTGPSMSPGTPTGGALTRALEQIGFFTGLGIVIVLLAAMALGRFSVIGVREARQAERAAQEAAAKTEPVAPAATRPNAPVVTQPNTPVSTGARMPLPSREATADTGTTTDKSADTKPDTERVDSTTAAR